MSSKKTPRICIYCGHEVTKERREHIVPEAIGGELTLKEVAEKSVCPRCNNEILSSLDKELCNRSHLSIIASQEIKANLWQVWDVEHWVQNLLIEAKPCWEDGELKGLVYHPQMIFEKEGPQIRGDAEEMERLGKDRIISIMKCAVQNALARHNAEKRGVFNFERLRTDISSRNYRMSPRVYTPHSFEEIEAKERSFVFRYLTAEDRTFALEAMASLSLGEKQFFNNSSQRLGSEVPPISLYFDLGLVVRAMMKIAVNLLAAYCSKTVVNCETFPHVMRLILGKRHPHPLHIAGNGFVLAEDVEELAHRGCHTFRITTLENQWVVYMSFFGGRIGSAVSFPGPNQEDWNTMEIVAPIHSREWSVTTSPIYQPLKVRFNWTDHKAITPSLKLQFAQSRMVVEPVPEKKERS